MDEKIKNLLKNAKSEEDAMRILADQKITLNDSDLEELRGGTLLAVDCATIVSIITRGIID